MRTYFGKIQEILPSDIKKNPVSINKEAANRIISNTVQSNMEIEKEVNEWEVSESKKNPISKKKEKQKLLKGALLPSGKHLTWKDELDKILK